MLPFFSRAARIPFIARGAFPARGWLVALLRAAGAGGDCLAGVLPVEGFVRGGGGPTLARAGRAAWLLPAMLPGGPAAGVPARCPEPGGG